MYVSLYAAPFLQSFTHAYILLHAPHTNTPTHTHSCPPYFDIGSISVDAGSNTLLRVNNIKRLLADMESFYRDSLFVEPDFSHVDPSKVAAGDTESVRHSLATGISPFGGLYPIVPISSFIFLLTPSCFE